MAGIQVLPSLDRLAGLRQGANNFVGQLLQGQQRAGGLADQQAIMQFIQARQQGQQPGLPQFQTQQGAAAFNSFLGQQQENVALGPGQGLFNRATGQQVGQSQPVTSSPSREISQQKLNAIKKLQAKEVAGTATQQDSKVLAKMLGGGSQVEINIGKSTGAERTAIAETESSLNAIDNLESLFNDENTRTGPVVGRVDPSLGLIGQTTQEQEEFMAATTAFTNRVIKDITGAQMSEPEARRIKAQIPLVTDPPARWKAKFNQTKRNLKILQQKRIKVLEGSGIRNPLGQSPVRTQGGGLGLPTASQRRGGPQQNVVPMTAVNPQTGQRIQSNDGGQTWQPVQ